MVGTWGVCGHGVVVLCHYGHVTLVGIRILVSKGIDIHIILWRSEERYNNPTSVKFIIIISSVTPGEDGMGVRMGSLVRKIPIIHCSGSQVNYVLLFNAMKMGEIVRKSGYEYEFTSS
jgi:hypothetical protein